MSLKNPVILRRKIDGLTEEQLQRIMDFLQGAVWCWCKNRRGEWFSSRLLLGDINKDWQGTPLIDLHTNRKGNEEKASIDSGNLLKVVLNDDKRCYDERPGGKIKEYLWLENEGDFTQLNQSSTAVENNTTL